MRENPGFDENTQQQMMYANEYERNRIMSKGDPSSDNTAVEKEDELSRWEMDVKRIISEIRNELGGKFEENGEWDYVNDDKSPLVNKQGVQKIITYFFRPICNQDTILNNFTNADVANLTHNLSKNAITFLARNHKNFEIDKKDFKAIIFMIHNKIFITLNRAKNGAERMYRQKNHQFSEHKFLTDAGNQGRPPSRFASLFGGS